MGATLSKAFTSGSGTGPGLISGQMTRQKLVDSTRDSGEFINNLFKVFTEKLTPEDFLALSDPAKCNKFVFALAESIGGLFRTLRIMPKTDKTTGIIVFQKLDTLAAKGDENKEICQTLAYFYIRIFQIFGALALTVVDDPGARTVL